ncbi:Predicted flavoprotein CzcO associated with the cation diffusion facilitator CzcD [Monaibacterium marinum]|uniref:Predicted flavoprotein CzcO associated with the cation diffusion facilitator CzcD n=1 Tax=Pontivivens marinum TaxID=1690039 RepID=A0A2C9CU00_9RHOB|nr:NAD(P)/FAD-dependent oxidoreductase [Monaibacterium marinum]SOH94693.1 Predicted flavoprotein CzcO associated with the cation diffusion facilitator CzcD [Monaibacterium marinum]
MDADVIIIGAGLSGICAASVISVARPNDNIVVLEGRSSIGGTWDLFQYPGVRSDSDMHTLGYSFRPWRGQRAITDGPSILEYIRDTARDQDVQRLIRFNHRLVAANWDSAAQIWHLHVDTPQGQQTLTCRFLLGCTGYYDYESGYLPDFDGQDDFSGAMVHPQHWPDGLDWAGKNVAIIGSGATAVTLLPELARDAAHVTLIQRTPSYVVQMPARDRIAGWLDRVVPARTSHAITRWKNIVVGMLSYQVTRAWPDLMGRMLAGKAAKRADVDPAHFQAPYGPWDQRICVAPDGDMFDALRDGASIRTGHIDRFEGQGVRMQQGDFIPADIIITATGLRLRLGGGADLSVDGGQVRFPDLVSYKGAMLSGVPNFAQMFGYTNASWTLKCELIARWVVRVLDRMERVEATSVVPKLPADMPRKPAVPLTAGYIKRGVGELPLQGNRAPWRVHQNYLRDIYEFRYAPVDDGVLTFTR